MGWCPVSRNLHMCGYLRQSDAGFVIIFYSRKGGAWMWLFPLCWWQQSKWRVLLLRAWCFRGKWDGRWRTQKIGRRRHWCLPQTLCPLGAHSSNRKIWGHGQGEMPFSSLVTRAHFWKAAVMWEGNIRAKESDFFVRMFRGRDVFTCNETWCKEWEKVGRDRVDRCILPY